MAPAEAGRAARSRLAAAATVALALAAAWPVVATANTIDVRDNRLDAIQEAINGADNGDRLLIHRGRYPEAVHVDKRLRLVGAPGRRPVINGQCGAFNTVAVTHNRVAIRHLKVVGASEGGNEIDYRFLRNGLVRDVRVKDTCGGLDGAEYGINLFFAPGVDVIANRAGPGFTDAGIYVGDIHDAGHIRVTRNETFRNNAGIIVEFSDPPAEILVRNNHVHHNSIAGEHPATGINVFGSTSMRYVRNRIADSGQYGIRLTSNSDNNVFNDNVLRRNPTHVLDEGSGNCGSGNVPNLIFPPC